MITGSKDTTPQGDAVIKTNDHKYQIVYLKNTDSILISILGSPFEATRQEAEQDLLTTLDISKADACRLSVTINTTISANPDEAGVDYSLSFCNNTATTTLAGIIVNKTSEKEVIDKLGQPAKSETNGQFHILYFPVGNTTRMNRIYTVNGTVQFVVEEILNNNTLYTDYTAQKQKKEDGVLYDPQQGGSGFNWYVFAGDGIAFLANQQAGYAISVQHFPPMSYQDYLNTVAKTFNLSQTPLEGN